MQLSNLHSEVLPDHLLELWPQVVALPHLQNFYLAGGTALALQIGHRQSVDLDFFTTTKVDTRLPQLIGAELVRPVEIISNWPGAIDFEIDNVKFSLWEYHFPVLEPHNSYQSLQLATPLTIGLFKLIAITSRATWKDIVDLYFIHQLHPLPTILEQFHTVAPRDFDSVYAGAKAFLEIDAFDKSPKPLMLVEVDLDKAHETVMHELMKGIEQRL